MLKGATLQDGRPILVFQTGWPDIHVHCSTYSSARICVEMMSWAKTATLPDGYVSNRRITIQPDFVLVRNEVKTPSFDGRSKLNGLLFAGVPCMNSLESILLFCERPAVQGALHRLQRAGADFPVVPQHFCSSSKSLMYGYTFPAVVKVGSAHAGCGKMKIHDHKQMSDFRSILEMMPDEHCMVEPFIESQGDLRIQKIGSNYRAFKRIGISGDWKTNTCTSIMDEIECTERYRRWADAAATFFGGLDILTVDAIIEAETGKEFILEVNGTSSGLHPDKAEEDNGFIKQLLLEKMNLTLC
ncbi:Synapsin-1 (Synapsin I) [Durusdinium trenchii]